MSSFRSYVSPWSKSSYSTPTSSSSYLRGSTGGSSTSLLSSSASNKDDKPYSSAGSYSRSRYGSSAIEKNSGDAGNGGSTTGISRDGGATSSTTSGYRSSALSSSTPSKSTATSRASYRSPYSSSTLGSSSSTSGVGGGARDRSASRDRLGYLSSVSSPRGRATSPEPEDSTSKNASSLSSSYSSRPSTLRPISISRATSLRSRYKDEPDYNSPSSPSTAPASSLRSPRADITPFKWTGRYSSSSSSSLRSPVGEVSPTVFGVSPEVKSEEGKAADGETPAGDKKEEKKEEDEKGEKKEEKESGKPEIVSMVTRGTSPNPPTTYGRIRRYELAWQIQKEVPRPPKRESVDAEVQTDKVEEENTHSSRYSRLSSPSSRLSTSPWYMDRYSSGSSSYVPRTYSRYGSTPSPSVSKRPSPVRSSSGSLANSTNDSGAPDNDTSSSSKDSSASAPKSEGTRSRDTKSATLDKSLSKEDIKIESSKTDSKSSEEPKTPSWKKSSTKTSEEQKSESKSSDSAKSPKITEDSKTPSWKKTVPKNSEETKTEIKSSELSKSKSSEDSKTMLPLNNLSKSSEDTKSSKSEGTSSDEPKIPAWKAALKQSLESKTSSQNSSQKTSEESKTSLSKPETKTPEEIKIPSRSSSKSGEDSKSASEASKSSTTKSEPKSSKPDTKTPEEIKTPSKISSKSSEDSKPTSEASKTSITKSEPKSSEEPKAPPGKRITKSSEESKSDSKTSKAQTPKSETKSSEDTQPSSPSTTPKTPPWKSALKNAEDSKKTKSTSSASEASDSASSKASEEKATENLTSALKETMRSDESIYPMTTEKEKETTSAPSITHKARPSSACSSASSSPSRGRERSPSAVRGTSRPPSVPTSAPSSRAGSSERTDPISSSSRTSAGVKSLSSYSSNQDLSASQKRLSSPRPPPSPRPMQRSNSAANLQAVTNKDFRKSTLNMPEEPTKSETAKSDPIETRKRVIKKKTTRSKTLGGSELSLPREPPSRSQLMLPLKPPPVGGKLVIPIALVHSDDDETSTSSDDEEESEEEMLENKFVGGCPAAKPPIPKKESPAEDPKSKQRVRRRGETGSWREAYKVEEDGSKKRGGSQSDASGEDSSGADRNRLKVNKIRREPSGELPWWMEGSKEAPPEGVIIRVDSSKDLATGNSTEDINRDSESGGEKRTLKLFRITRDPSGELAWWMDESKPVPEGIVVKAPSTHNIPDMTSAEIGDKSASESSSGKKKQFKLKRDPSGDIPWWMDGSKDAPPEGVIIRVDSAKDLATEKSAEDSSKDSDYGSGRKTLKLFKIARDPSGELPWWLDSSQAPPEGVIIKAPSSVNIADMTSADASKNSTSESSREKKKPFKLMKDPSGEIAWWMDGSAQVPEGVIRMESSSSLASKASSENAKKKSVSTSASEGGKPIKPYRDPSGERAWWMEGSNEPLPDGVIMIETTPSVSSSSKSSEGKKRERRKIMKITRQPTGELAWWMDGSDEPAPEGVVCEESSHSIPSKADSSEGSKSSGIRTGKLIPIWRQPSGERAWWLDSDSAVPEGVERVESSHSVAGSQGETSKLSRTDSQEEGSGKSAGTRRRLWRVESGERAWWMEGNEVPEGIQKIESTHSLGSVGAEVAKKAVAAKKGSAGASSTSESESESESSSSEEEVEDDMPMEGSSDEEEGEGEGKKGAFNGGIPRGELGVRTSPDGVEEVAGPEAVRRTTAGGGDVDKEEEEEEEDEREVMRRQKERARRNLQYFIGRHTNIDDLLGGEVAAPAESVAAMVAAVEASQRADGRGVKIEKYDDVGSEDESSSPVEEVDPSQVRIHDSTAQTPTLLQQQTVTESTGSEHAAGRPPPPPPPPPGAKLDDVALQVYKDGDYGAYLDLEASISEQPEEFEGFQSNRKNSIVLRTQLSVRVHAVIEKLLNSEGRELRRALFSLKQIFQEDKDLVHEFVQNEGLACLIKVGSEADQNYQNYILRALGQVMLYVDGMNGVMAHNQTVQWLYSLIASRFRLVVKTALKLLLVFAEYVESNCLLLIRAVLTVDNAQGLPPWSNIMRLLKDYDTADTELLIYAMTLINRTLNGIPDQDTYYDQVDALEEQGMESVVQRYMSKQGTDLDLLRQFQIYEAVLHHEDGEEKGAPLKQLDETIRKTLRNRKSLADSDSSERRKSRRHSTGTSPMSQSLVRQRHCNGHANLRLKPPYPGHEEEGEGEEESSSGSSHSPSPPATGTPTSPLNNHMQFNSGTQNKVNENVGVTPALRRRRERAERQRSFIREQQESGATLRASLGQTEDGKSERIENGNASTNGHHDSSAPWSQHLHKDANCNVESSGAEEGEGGERAALRRIRRENTVRDLTQKLASQGGLLASPTEERVPRDIGDMSGIVSKAKEGLARSKSKADLRSPTDSTSSGRGGTQAEIKKSETELHWEELLNNSKRPLTLCDLDFTDLMEEDDTDVLSPALPTHGGLLPPPPPPPCVPVPPPPATRVPPAPPPVGGGFGRMPPPPPIGYSRPGFNSPAPAPPSPASLKKSKKTVKLFWKEVREDPVVLSKLSGGIRSSSGASMIWDEIQPVTIDTQKLEHLFESRAKDIIGKKQQELNKSKEIIVLDPKRSNAINIGMTKLPPPRSIKTAILKMDSTIVNREGIEKLLTMLPTEEERSRIQEAQSANPDVPLGSAEQFLLTLASISELSARLKLWAFKLDYENSEKEVAEPLMDLKQGMETLRASKTFRSILSTLLSVGIFLNGSEVKGFQIEYLAKVPEVKDTVHKHSLLHHLCHIVMEKFPDSSDLYSEIGAVTRASKVDFEDLATSIQRMEQECKASWDHLKVIAKHDGSTMVKVKMSDFLADCAERIIVLGIVHRRVMNRFNKFLLWLGIPLHRVQDTKPNEFCKIISEFSLEYRTTRERVLQQLEKKASHRERNKTRGKMITDVGKFRTKEDRADAELRQLLGSDLSEIDSIHGSLPWRRQKKDVGNTRSRGLTDILRGTNGNECIGDNMTDGDDEILESLVKTATKGPSTRTTPRERKRTRHADRKSLRRTLKNGLSEEEKQHLAAYIKGY